MYDKEKKPLPEAEPNTGSGRPDTDADGNVVLCAASAYEEKYYLNPLFNKLPEDVKKELKIISVLFVEEIGGTFLMEFDSSDELVMRTEALGSDYSYDEIGAQLMCREIRRNREELLYSLELFYRLVILGKDNADRERDTEK